MTETSADKFLGGRVTVRQMRNGFRGGLDAVMLAAAVPARSGDEVLELGSGAGTASLCLAARVAGVVVTGVEIDAGLAALANENARLNASVANFVEGDVLDLPTELKRDFAHVFCNPPFHDEQGEASPEPAKDRALRDAGRFGDWMEAGFKRTLSGGTFTVIFRSDRLGEALSRLPDRGIAIYPLWPRAGEPAKRVVVQARKGSRAPSALRPGLVLHEANGGYTEAADRVLRHGAALDISASRNE